MRIKLLWPALAIPIPKNAHEHGHMLGLYIDNTLKLIQDRYKYLAESFKNFFQASSAFIKKTRQELSNHNILKEVRMAADMSTRYKIFFEE